MTDKLLNVCFICLNNARRPGRKGRPPVATEKVPSPKLKTFLTYILDHGQHGSSVEESEDLKECITKACNDGELLLCSVCRFHVCKIYDMHLQLEAVQLLIINTLNEVKGIIQRYSVDRRSVHDIDKEVGVVNFNENVPDADITRGSRIVSTFHSLLRQGFLERSIDDGLQLRLHKLENCGYDVVALRQKLVQEVISRQSLKLAGTALMKRKLLQKSPYNFEQNSWKTNDTTEPSNSMETESEEMEMSVGVVIKTEMDSDSDYQPGDLSFDDGSHSNFDDDIDSIKEQHPENVNPDDPEYNTSNLVADLSTNYEHLVQEYGHSTVSGRTRSRHQKVEHVERELKKANDAEKKKNKPPRRHSSDDESSDYTPGKNIKTMKRKRLTKLKRMAVGRKKVSMDLQKVASEADTTPPSPKPMMGPKKRPCVKKPRVKRTTKRWHCDICLEMVNFNELQNHLRNHPEVENPYTCSRCRHEEYRRTFGSYKGLVWHCMKRSKHPKDMECIFCPENPMFDLKALCEHLYEHHKLPHPKIQCTFARCAEEFYDPISQMRHRKMKHGEKLYICDLCSLPLRDKFDLDKHINSVHNDTTYQCAFCPLTFKNTARLRRHEALRHTEQPVLTCEYCQKEVKECLMKHHVKTYHLNPKHYCKFCRKEFVKLHTKIRHEEAHVGEAKYKCTKCSYAGATKGGLQNHMKLHGEKKFKCQYCPKTFAIVRYLEDHLRTHTKETPFVCEVCGMAFNARNSLSGHRRKTHGIAPIIRSLVGKGAGAEIVEKGSSKYEDAFQNSAENVNATSSTANFVEYNQESFLNHAIGVEKLEVGSMQNEGSNIQNIF